MSDQRIISEIISSGQENSDYSYDNKIKEPKDIGISKKGEWDNIEKNIDGLNSYIDVLISGKSKAAVGGQPLGDKKFINTEIKCKDSDGNEHDRYFYVDNVPYSSGGNSGLIPGVISKFSEFNVNEISEIFSSSEDDSKNICSPITMQTINNAHSVADETQYVTIGDQETINPCSFQNKKNPITGCGCGEENCPKESFTTIKPMKRIPNDNLIKMYYAMVGCLGLYIVFCTLQKRC